MVNKEIFVREIHYNSDEYLKETELRDRVLRKPLGMHLYDENLDAEKNDIHIGAFLDDELVGVLILTRINADLVKMRQVAVETDMQSKQIGTGMVFFAEEYSKAAGYSTIVLNARKTAVPFYQKLGYDTISDEFLEINLPHYKMCKNFIHKFKI